MNSSSHDSQNPVWESQPIRADSLVKKRSAPDREFLEKVLEETLLAADGSEKVTQADLEAVQGVARRFGGQPFKLEPVAVELVQAILSSYFRTPPNSPEPWQAMSVEIAQSLLEDPVLKERLEALWLRLIEESR